MNIYSFNPQWLKNDMLNTFISILKVKKIYYFIPYIDYIPSTNIEIFKWDGNNYDVFLKKCIFDFVNTLSKPLFYDGTYKRIVKDTYNESLGLNPIYNIEKLDDPNILILWTPEYCERGVASQFRYYAMNILNKYGTIDYMERICFYMFDSFLSCSYVFIKDTNRGEKRYILSKAVIPENMRSYTLSEKYLSNKHKLVSFYYDPLLSYLFHKTNTITKGNTLQECFLTDEGIKEYEKKCLIEYSDFRQEYWNSYEYDNSDFEDVCNKELDYIINNGGDWIDD